MVSAKKVLDESNNSNTNNFQTTKEIPFRQGLDQEKAKKITTLVRDNLPKVKTQIQGAEVRVMSAKKDELQAAMQLSTTLQQCRPEVNSNSGTRR